MWASDLYLIIIIQAAAAGEELYSPHVWRSTLKPAQKIESCWFV